MGDYDFVSGLIFTFFVFLIILINVAHYNASITCPYDYATLTGVNQTDPITWFIGNLGLFFSPCANLPFWIYIIIIVWLIAIFRWLTPFIWH